MILWPLHVLASVNDTGSGGPLTLLLPLVFVFIVLGIWLVAARRRRGRD
jgi:hypothetical protein